MAVDHHADANDEAQFSELWTQAELTKRAWDRDVQVSQAVLFSTALSSMALLSQLLIQHIRY